MNQLLIVGGASLDVLHLADRSVGAPGGAGMYAAMAARRCGADITLFGPRPDPLPTLLEPIADRLTLWLGPHFAPEEMSHFEISYRGDKTDYLEFQAEIEGKLSPQMLPADLSVYDHVHVCPLKEPANQLAFIQACRQRGARRISSGTCPVDALERPQAVQSLLDETDIFFMNAREARRLFGLPEAATVEPGKVLFITLGEEGAYIVQGETVSYIQAPPAHVLDPTGAGDCFCGATLAYLLQHQHPIMAARQAMPLTAEMVGRIGPEALLSDAPPPEMPRDERVRLNEEQIEKIAAIIAGLDEAAPSPFVGPDLPPVGHPHALDYFFAGTLQQFSFWDERDDRYDQPLVAPIGGVEKKGSDYLWGAFGRQLAQEADFFNPERQAFLSQEEMQDLFRADDGKVAMPALDLHLQQANRYGRDMLALELTPQKILDKALASDQPFTTLLDTLDQIGGYKEDPLRKKSGLLAMILNQRPERFLPLDDDQEIAPVVDYHAMRSSLRQGLVEVEDSALKEKLRQRQVVAADEEWAVRHAAYEAIDQVVDASGKSTGAVDEFFFSARQRCPEMSVPKCSSCPANQVCAKRIELFQPIFRTTFY